MSRVCEITGKKPLVGNSVSHANNKTKRRFLPNLQDAAFYSTSLKRNIKVYTTTAGIRTVEHKGGIDAFLLDTQAAKLNPQLRRLKKQIAVKVGDQPKPAPKKRYPSAKSLRVAAAKKAA